MTFEPTEEHFPQLQSHALDIGMLRDAHSNGTLPTEIFKLAQTHILKSRPWRYWLSRVTFIVGLGLMISSLVYVLAFNWNALHRIVKLVLPLLAFIGSAFYIVRRWSGDSATIVQSSTDWKREVGIFFSAVLAGVLFSTYGIVYQTGADAYQLFFTWTVLSLVFALSAQNMGNLILTWSLGTLSHFLWLYQDPPMWMSIRDGGLFYGYALVQAILLSATWFSGMSKYRWFSLQLSETLLLTALVASLFAAIGQHDFHGRGFLYALIILLHVFSRFGFHMRPNSKPIYNPAVFAMTTYGLASIFYIESIIKAEPDGAGALLFAGIWGLLCIFGASVYYRHGHRMSAKSVTPTTVDTPKQLDADIESSTAVSKGNHPALSDMWRRIFAPSVSTQELNGALKQDIDFDFSTLERPQERSYRSLVGAFFLNSALLIPMLLTVGGFIAFFKDAIIIPALLASCGSLYFALKRRRDRASFRAGYFMNIIFLLGLSGIWFQILELRLPDNGLYLVGTLGALLIAAGLMTLQIPLRFSAFVMTLFGLCCGVLFVMELSHSLIAADIYNAMILLGAAYLYHRSTLDGHYRTLVVAAIVSHFLLLTFMPHGYALIYRHTQETPETYGLIFSQAKRLIYFGILFMFVYTEMKKTRQPQHLQVFTGLFIGLSSLLFPYQVTSALIVCFIGFQSARKGLLILGGSYLTYYFILYYYDLSMTLWLKGTILFASGCLYMTVYLFLENKLARYGLPFRQLVKATGEQR